MREDNPGCVFVLNTCMQKTTAICVAPSYCFIQMCQQRLCNAFARVAFDIVYVDTEQTLHISMYVCLRRNITALARLALLLVMQHGPSVFIPAFYFINLVYAI